MSRKGELIEEARRWKIAIPAKATIAQIEEAIAEAKARAHAPPPAAPAPAPAAPAAPPATGGKAGRYKALCNLVLGRGQTVDPGSEVVLNAEQAESLLKQAAVEPI